jgi:hypothetical protein
MIEIMMLWRVAHHRYFSGSNAHIRAYCWYEWTCIHNIVYFGTDISSSTIVSTNEAVGAQTHLGDKCMLNGVRATVSQNREYPTHSFDTTGETCVLLLEIHYHCPELDE